MTSDAVLAQLFNSDTEGQELKKFVDGNEVKKKRATRVFFPCLRLIYYNVAETQTESFTCLLRNTEE